MPHHYVKFRFIPKANLCLSCKYSYGNIRYGLSCRLTQQKANYYGYCPYFTLSPKRDAYAHSKQRLKTQQHNAIIRYWEIVSIILVIFSPIITLFANSDQQILPLITMVLLLLSLLAYSIFNYYLKKITQSIPTIAFIYATFANILKKYKRFTDEEYQIVYQTIVRLYGHNIAVKTMKTVYQKNLIISENKLKLLLSALNIYDKRMIFTALCELFVFNNYQGCLNDPILVKWLKYFKITQDEYFRLKEIYLAKEYNFQSQKQKQNQHKTYYQSTYSVSKYYKILGLTPQASVQEIKKKFRELAKKYHPDHQHDPVAAQQAAEHFKIILNAYEQLKKIRGFN